MTYNGSWFLSNINDATANTIGADTVGFMAFPTVSGGKGTAAQWPSNAGTVTATSVKTYGPKGEAWLKCIVQNYGAEALKTSGSLSGLKVNGTVAGVPATTQMIQSTMASATESVLWFEALMDSKSSALASTNVSLLVTGQMTPADYMQKLQASIEANK